MAVGAGGSEEAAFDLRASVPAGSWHFVLDCIIIQPVDTTFELIWRRGSADMPVITPFTEHYDPIGAGEYHAQPFSYDEQGSAIDFVSGDQLVFRYTANGSSDMSVYEPNGDGAGSTDAHDPNITLPVGSD